MRTLIVLTALTLLAGCRDRGQDRVGADWIGSSINDRARLRPADPQWADFTRSRDITVLGTIPERDEVVAAPVEAAPDAGPTGPATPAELMEAAVSGPATVPLLIASARGLLRVGRVDDALAALRRAQTREPDNLEVQLYLGRALDRLGRSADAADVFAKALRLDPNNDEARYGRAISLIRLGRPQQAKPLLEALGASHADDVNVQRLLAIYKSQAGDEAGALDALRKAATIASETGDQVKLGNAEARSGDYKAAAEALQKAVAADADNPALQLQLGTALGYTGDYPAAEAALIRATELNPGAGIAWRNLAAVREHRGDAEGAAKAYEALLSHDQSPYDRRAVKARIEQLRTLGLGGPAGAGATDGGNNPVPAGDTDGGG